MTPLPDPLSEAVEAGAKALYEKPPMHPDEPTFEDLPVDGDPDVLGSNTQEEFKGEAAAALTAALDSLAASQGGRAYLLSLMLPWGSLDQLRRHAVTENVVVLAELALEEGTDNGGT